MASPWTYEDLDRMLEAFTARTTAGESEEKARRRRRILDAASELFARQGYRKTSLDEVARNAGVAKGTVYLYFTNKADLLTHALVEEKRLSLEEMRPVFDPDISARERLYRWIRLIPVVGAKMPMTSKLLAGDHEVQLVMSELDSDQRADVETQQVGLVAVLLDEAAGPHSWDQTELQERAKALMVLIYGVMLADEDARMGLSTERAAELVAELVVHGVGGVGGAPEKVFDLVGEVSG